MKKKGLQLHACKVKYVYVCGCLRTLTSKYTDTHKDVNLSW